MRYSCALAMVLALGTGDGFRLKPKGRQNVAVDFQWDMEDHTFDMEDDVREEEHELPDMNGVANYAGEEELHEPEEQMGMTSFEHTDEGFDEEEDEQEVEDEPSFVEEDLDEEHDVQDEEDDDEPEEEDGKISFVEEEDADDEHDEAQGEQRVSFVEEEVDDEPEEDEEHDVHEEGEEEEEVDDEHDEIQGEQSASVEEEEVDDEPREEEQADEEEEMHDEDDEVQVGQTYDDVQANDDEAEQVAFRRGSLAEVGAVIPHSRKCKEGKKQCFKDRDCCSGKCDMVAGSSGYCTGKPGSSPDPQHRRRA